MKQEEKIAMRSIKRLSNGISREMCAAFGSGTEHIAFYAALRQTTCEVEHHFLHTSPYGPEFSNLE